MNVYYAVPFFVGLALLLRGLVAEMFQGDTRARHGWVAAGAAVQCVARNIIEDKSGAAAWAGLSAFELWMWWNSGGGDDTRRRLRRWADRFQGTRHTASTAAMTPSPLAEGPAAVR